MDFFVKIAVAMLCLTVYLQLLIHFIKSKSPLPLTPSLFLTGIIGNISDTLGIGSFAVLAACNTRWKFVDDKQLPGTMNAHGILPAMLQSLLFLNFIEFEPTLLYSFVGAACLGGMVSGLIVSKLEKQTIRLAMTVGFIAIALLLIAHQLKLLPIGGEATSLSMDRLLIGIPAMFFVGMLPAVGLGFYVPIQIVLFLLGLSPLVAFPIMTTAGAVVQTVTAYTFITNKEVAIGESIVLGLSGIIGVLIAVPLITYVNFTTLRYLLLIITLYNAFSMWKAYRRGRQIQFEIPQT